MGNICCGGSDKPSLLSQKDISQSSLIKQSNKTDQNQSQNKSLANNSQQQQQFQGETPTPRPENSENRLIGNTREQQLNQLTGDPQYDNISGAQLTIGDFDKLYKLGQGAFGQVHLVQKKDTGEKYAMKYIPKIQLVQSNLVERSLIEKRVLQDNRCPFIVDLKYSFQSKNKVYYLMEYIPGGQLFEIQQGVGRFNQEVAKFIIAEVILGIECMHTILNVIYRDLKPENLLLTADGHVKIADFGLSKIFKDKNEKTYTFAGTPEYLAPEIITNKGHTKDVDLWCIGIFLYELLDGNPPFTTKPRNLDRIQSLIIKNRPNYPKHFSPEAIDFISNMLQTDPSLRLGSKDFKDIKSHPLFSDINWEELSLQQTKSPLLQFVKKTEHRKLVKPRPIYETPVKPGLKLPHIKGISYNPDVLNHH